MLTSLNNTEKPSARFTSFGQAALSDAELLSLIIKGNDNETKSLETARHILSHFNNDISKVARASTHELLQFKGMTALKATSLLAAFELHKRRSLFEGRVTKIGCSGDIDLIMRPHLEDLAYEEFWIVLLNRGNMVLCSKMISKGGVTGTVVDPKLIFKHAIEATASGIVLCHNHPSGNTNPSDADISLTKKIKEAGILLDIQILDHIIIAGTKYFSFADDGRM